MEKQIHYFERNGVTIEVEFIGQRRLERFKSRLDDGEIFELSKCSRSADKECSKMCLDCTRGNLPERLQRNMRTRNSMERGFEGFDAGEKRGDGRMVDDLGKFLLTKALLILGLKLIMRLKFLGTMTWVLRIVLKLGGLKDLRSKSLKKGVGGRRRQRRRVVGALEAGSGEIAAAATGVGKMGLMRIVMRSH